MIKDRKQVAKAVEQWVAESGPLTSTQVTTRAQRLGYDPFIARRSLRRPWFKLGDGGWTVAAGVVFWRQRELFDPEGC